MACGKPLRRVVGEKYIVNDKGLIKNNSILVQNIVAHIMNPTPHIKIIAMPSSILDNKDEYILLNTVNQLENISNLDTKFILAILNSKLISWYTYRFIYGKAIMTMHFDSVITAKIPMPNINLNNKSDKDKYDIIIKYSKSLIENNIILNNLSNINEKQNIVRKIEFIENNIEKLICEIYKII